MAPPITGLKMTSFTSAWKARMAAGSLEMSVRGTRAPDGRSACELEGLVLQTLAACGPFTSVAPRCGSCSSHATKYDARSRVCMKVVNQSS